MNSPIINHAGAHKIEPARTQIISSARFHEGTRLRPGATLERLSRSSPEGPFLWEQFIARPCCPAKAQNQNCFAPGNTLCFSCG
jgi:hypothetical protein